MKKKLILRIAICAVLSALYFIFDLISIKAGPFKISVSGLPIIIVAIIYGPVDAMIVGFTGAFLGQMVSYGFTPTTILWCIPAMARGLFVGLCTKKLTPKDEPIKLIIIIVISSLMVTTLNTIVMYIDSKIYDYYSYAYIFGALFTRYVTGIITAIIYSVLTPVIYEPVSKILRIKKETNKNEKRSIEEVFNFLSIAFGIISIATCIIYSVSLIFAGLGLICSIITKKVKESLGFKLSIYGIIALVACLLVKLILQAIANGIIQAILGLLFSFI